MAKLLKRVNLVILDSVGIGEAPDAAACGDEGVTRWAILLAL